ncbi:unnamed protein product [Rodentolepis nana]|uniref:Transcription initiation factor IIF subunit alpha n=1 Tax=Rodentolepis nana TaxID=102285 RepID=A0A0R3TFU1_RODNA|nr:unnamed protein product [Rodentolepis nana]
MDLYPNPIEKKSTGGAGSVFGADRRLKARFRKHGSALQEYSAEKQPLLLTVGKGKIAKHYRGVKEGTLNDSKYFIFTHRSDGGFDAYPVSDWYTVKQGIKTKRLNDEGGEGEFSNGDKVCGKFKIIQNAKPATRSYPVGIEEKLVVSEFDEWKVYDRSDGEVGSGDEESDFKQIIAQKRMEEKRRRRTNKRRGRPAVTRRKHKNNFTVGSDDEDGGPFDMNGEESDIDDYDEYELDYLTDSTSDEENLPEDEREKSYEIQGVDQEVGFISGEEEDDDEEEKEIRENEKKENRLDAQSQQQKQWFSGEVFLDEMEKASSSSSSSGSSDTREDFNAESQKKCSKSSGPSEKFAPPPKRFKTSEIPPPPPSNPPVKSSHEKLFDTIRNYLLRRPITMQELLRKLGAKGLLSSDNTRNTSIVAKILHELKPLQHCFQGKQQFYLRH